MTREQVLRLHSRDEVYWNDPDGGKLSRFIVILEISIPSPDDNDPAVSITDVDGSDLECFASELS